MKKLYFLFLSFFALAFGFGQDMVITGAFDGPLTGGVPKVVEIYVISDIADLSLHGFGSANNGGGTDGVELTFSGSANAGDFIYITDDAAAFTTYFGLTADYESAAASVNGDDALELFFDGNVIDTFGDINTDGTGEPWDYVDGWAYRNDSTGPDGTSFNISSWSFSGPNATDGCTTNASCSSVFPIGTYTYSGTPCGVSLGSAAYVCSTNTIGDNNDGVTIQIPYTGLDAGITSVTTTSAGSVFGDDPSVDLDGTIVITGLSEGDAWDITLNGGNCDGATLSGTVPADQCDPAPNTCFDLSGGAELFELVVVTPNSDGDEWTFNTGTYSMNGFVGGGQEQVETWLIFGPLDMTSVTDLTLAFNAAESFGTTDLVVAYTPSYSGCPSTSSWTTAQTIADPGAIEVDLSVASGTDVFIGVQYIDDGVDGYSGWELSNVALEAFGTCPTLGTRPTSDCATCDLALQTENYVCLTNTSGDNNDGVTIEIPYTGLEDTITSLSTTSGGTVAGDDPATVTDGTITITGLSEGDAWDITINGGDCDGTVISGTIPSAVCDPVTTDLVINEILADPDGTTGDANGDGTVDTSQDEFVEIYNTGTSSIDLSNYTISDGFGVRHVFPAGSILAPSSFVSVFGGGTPTGIDFLVQTASSGSLGFNNSGDSVILKNASDVVVVEYTYGSEGGNNQSIAREPDFTGAFVQHLSHTTNPVQFSPGAMNDGTTLSNNEFELNGVSIYPNPTNTGFVTINSNNTETINVAVFDILGKQVLESNLVNNQLNVSGLSNGIYIMKLTQGNASVTKKLVIK